MDETWKVLKQSGFRKYFSNISWLMAEKIVRGILLFVVDIYVVRYLGPERFGLLSYAISFVALFATINTLGLDNIVIRELVKDESKINELLGTAFFLKLSGAFLVLIILCFVFHFALSNSLGNLLIFIIASSTIFQSFNVIDFYFQSKVLSKYVVYTQLVLLIVSSFIKLFLIWIQAPLLYFSVVFVIDSVILATGLIIAYLSQKFNISDWRFKPELAIRLLRDSWPLILSGIAVSIYVKIDQVMIKHILNTEAVGQYAVAARLSEACYFIPVIICGSFFPAIINAKNKSREVYQAKLQRLYNLMVWTFIPVVLVIMLVANDMIRLLFGAEFSKAGSVLTIHIWAGLFVFLGTASNKWLIAENYTKVSFFRTFVGMVVNIILNIIFIPRYGINGAAFATLISYAVSTFSVVFIKRTRLQAYMMIMSIASLGMYKNKESIISV